MTNTWADFKNANLVVIMGGNAAEAHPCGFKWVTEAKAHNNAKLIVVDRASPVRRRSPIFTCRSVPGPISRGSAA
jgi:anaerobic selenocysteine-containing dehydrogenase